MSFTFVLVAFFFMFHWFKRKFPDEQYKSLFIMAISFLTVNALFFFYSYMYRPDIYVMVFGLVNYYFLDLYLSTNKTKHLLISAVFAGMAALTHLNGMIFILSGFVFLLIKKRYPKAFIYGLVAGVIMLFYFIDMLSETEFNAFIYQFFNDPNLIEKTKTPLLKVLEEHRRFFMSEIETTFSVLLITTLLFHIQKIKRTNWRSDALFAIAHSIFSIHIARVNLQVFFALFTIYGYRIVLRY